MKMSYFALDSLNNCYWIEVYIFIDGSVIYPFMNWCYTHKGLSYPCVSDLEKHKSP